MYEAGSLTGFFTWLISGAMPVGYAPATNAWVSETIVGLDLNIYGPYNLVRPETGTNRGSTHVFDLLILGLGSNINRQELTLAYGTMNNYKGKWLQGSTPATTSVDDRTTKILIRDVSTESILLILKRIITKRSSRPPELLPT